MTTREIATMPDSELLTAAELYDHHATTLGERIIAELLREEICERKERKHCEIH